MNDISELLRKLLDEYSSVDMAESEFQRMINEDELLRTDYENWCTDLGYQKRSGFKEFIEEIFENQDSIWDVFNEYGDDEV